MGKGTLVARLVAADDRLWLSRSWTTRPPRPGETGDDYEFVTRDEFLAHRDAGGFLEWNEFAANGHLYGTPIPVPPPGRDVVLEIDLNGARQVRDHIADAVIILVLPPSTEELERRLRRRGDSAAQIEERVNLAATEEAEGRLIADHVVVNDDLVRATEEVAGILERSRRTADGSSQAP